jgi:hypothetical protein
MGLLFLASIKFYAQLCFVGSLRQNSPRKHLILLLQSSLLATSRKHQFQTSNNSVDWLSYPLNDPCNPYLLLFAWIAPRAINSAICDKLQESLIFYLTNHTGDFSQTINGNETGCPSRLSKYLGY